MLSEISNEILKSSKKERTNMNPNSAVERVKNHLSYKLGQELIKPTMGGGI